MSIEVLGDHSLVRIPNEQDERPLVVVGVQSVNTAVGPKDWVSFTKVGLERTYPAAMTLLVHPGMYQLGDVVGIAIMKKPRGRELLSRIGGHAPTASSPETNANGPPCR